MNSRTKKQIDIYLQGDYSTGLLLVGADNSYILNESKTLASSILSTPIDFLDRHPDFMYITLNDDKKSIGVEQASDILRKGNLRPTLADHIVIIINHMDCMTVEAQNKLLKLIEDNLDVVVIGIAASNALLITIRSRMCTIAFPPLSKEDFLSECVSRNLPDGELFFYITSGSIEMVSTFIPMLPLYKEVVRVVESGNLIELQIVLKLVKEKDKQAYSDKYAQHTLQLYRLLEACFTIQVQYMFGIASDFMERCNKYTKMELFNKLDLLRVEKSRCTTVSYTKDNFFLTIVKLI